MKDVEEYLERERLLKENGEPDNSIFGVKLYKNKKAAKISKENWHQSVSCYIQHTKHLMRF